MEKEQQKEWYELNINTWRMLRQREHVLHSKHYPLFQFLVMPWFQNTWCLEFVRTGETVSIYHTTWRKDLDIESFSTPIERLKHPSSFTPTLKSDLLTVSSSTVELILKRFDWIQIPLQQIKNFISLDGIAYEMQIGD